MHFESANRSIIRSVRQSDLLSAWLRVAHRERALPLIHQFRPDHLDDERPDLMYYDIKQTADSMRFLILHGGDNLIRAFGTVKGEGKFLDEIIDVPRKHRHPPSGLHRHGGQRCQRRARALRAAGAAVRSE